MYATTPQVDSVMHLKSCERMVTFEVTAKIHADASGAVVLLGTTFTNQPTTRRGRGALYSP